MVAYSPKVLEYVRQLAYVTREVQLEVVHERVAAERSPHLVRVGIVPLRALLLTKCAEERLTRWKLRLLELLERVEVLVWEDSFPKEELVVCDWIPSGHQRLE